MVQALVRDWDPPSPRLADLLRRAVLLLLDQVEELLAAIDASSFEVNRELLELAPALVDPLRAAGRSNVTVWVTANLRKPGLPVPIGEDPLSCVAIGTGRAMEDPVYRGVLMTA